jgi:hypothetical protein
MLAAHPGAGHDTRIHVARCGYAGDGRTCASARKTVRALAPVRAPATAYQTIVTLDGYGTRMSGDLHIHDPVSRQAGADRRETPRLEPIAPRSPFLERERRRNGPERWMVRSRCTISVYRSIVIRSIRRLLPFALFSTRDLDDWSTGRRIHRPHDPLRLPGDRLLPGRVPPGRLVSRAPAARGGRPLRTLPESRFPLHEPGGRRTLTLIDCADSGSACGLVIEYGENRAKMMGFVSIGASRRALQMVGNDAEVEIDQGDRRYRLARVVRVHGTA